MYKVFVVEDEFVIREGIRNMMQYHNRNYTLCGEAGDGEMALAMIEEVRPDILITDIKMPFMDGLALSKIIKETMPWIRIVILSGYDEFDFARDAISIGVEEYLLKPVGAAELFGVLDKIVLRLEEEKKQRSDHEALQKEFSSSAQTLRNQFFDKLVMGALSTADALAEAKKVKIDLISKYYLVLNVEIDANGTDYKDLSEAKRELGKLIKNRKDVISFFRNEDNFLLLLKGTAEENIEREVYKLADELRREYAIKTEAVLTIGIGSIADRIGGISHSFLDSKKAIKFLNRFKQGEIISIKDIEREPAITRFMIEEYNTVDEKLKYATRQDIPQMIRYYTQDIDYSNTKSLLFTYYILMDIVVASSRLITELGGETRKVIPEIDNPTLLFDIASSEKGLTAFIEDLLERVIDFRDSTQTMRYGNVIRKARQYINEHYASAGISLNTVAAEVALSPNHFSTVFSQETGETFIEYLTRIRIERAKHLLTATTMRSADIALAVGYNEPHYFSYLFKKNVGMSAREYRISQHKIIG
ncbi:response regulator [Cellulosilyticum sp. I15G10I2]|uniref:response regulator n=1 Tax=Cellulosilyticum sp. I15G10I2 TaxID=1892843 RepID=UPI00085BFDE9|nr:response regulator [Cellulosilyticum sp. I15G10I2]